MGRRGRAGFGDVSVAPGPRRRRQFYTGLWGARPRVGAWGGCGRTGRRESLVSEASVLAPRRDMHRAAERLTRGFIPMLPERLLTSRCTDGCLPCFVPFARLFIPVPSAVYQLFLCPNWSDTQHVRTA